MRLSHQSRIVLRVFLDSPSEEAYGYELAKAADLPSGTIYPILHRFEASGLVASRWEEIGGEVPRRRRYYRLTGEGRRVGEAATAENAGALRQLVPGWST